MIPLIANKQGQGGGAGAGWVAGWTQDWLPSLVHRHSDQSRSMTYRKRKQNLGSSVEVCETH